jgi:hypothetical protein
MAAIFEAVERMELLFIPRPLPPPSDQFFFYQINYRRPANEKIGNLRKALSKLFFFFIVDEMRFGEQ